MARKRKSPDEIANEFNAMAPVGTAVLYRSHPTAEPRETKTRSEAWVLSGHTPVVMIEGLAGGVAVTSLEVQI